MRRKLLTLGISLLVLGAIYYKIDIHRLGAVLCKIEPRYLTISLALVLPLTLLTAARLEMIAPARTNIGFIEANRLILVASVLNMILPAKMGDVAKAFFMKSDSAPASLTFALVVFEKSADMLSLLFWCALGLLLYPAKGALFCIAAGIVITGLVAGTALLGSRRFAQIMFKLTRKFRRLRSLESGWREMQEFFWSDKVRLLAVATMSIFIWFLHLLQIWLFIFALRASAPFLVTMALAPLAILAGLLPLTFAGIGTRDAALIALFQPYFAAPVAAALGLLCTARYVIPALAGLPLVHRYSARIRA